MPRWEILHSERGAVMLLSSYMVSFTLLVLTTALFVRSANEMHLAERSAASVDVPLFLAHGEYDEVVVIERGHGTRDLLSTLGYAVDWHSYPMGHEVCMDEVADLSRWLVARLGQR